MSRIFSSAVVWLSWAWVLSSFPNAATAADGLGSAPAQTIDAAPPSDNTDASAASGFDQPLAVFGVAAGDNYEQGQALAWALRRALETSIEWKNAEGEYSFDALLSDLGCPETPDLACLQRIAKKTNVDRFIWGTLKLSHGHIKAYLGFFDHDTVTPITHLEYTAKMTDTFDEDLLRLASVGLGKLLGPLHFPVIVHSRERTGNILVDDVSVGKLNDGVANVSATAGDHRLRLVLPDDTAIVRSFQVRVEHATLVRLDFINVPEK
jgi:hypothetical protein